MSKILIVEDDLDLRDSISRYLGMVGMTVRQTASVSEFLAVFDSFPADVVLLDVNLPDGSGFDAISRLRSGDCGPSGLDVGIIMLTARERLEDRVHGLSSGADAYMIKPVQLRELEATIGSLMRRVRRQASSPGAPHSRSSRPPRSPGPPDAGEAAQWPGQDMDSGTGSRAGSHAGTHASPRFSTHANSGEETLQLPAFPQFLPGENSQPHSPACAPGYATGHSEAWGFDAASWSLLTPAGRRIPLTNAEFSVLQVLMASSGQPVSRDEIARSMGKDPGEHENRNIDAILTRLRRKVRAESGETLPVRAARAIGYVFAAPVLPRIGAALAGQAGTR